MIGVVVLTLLAGCGSATTGAEVPDLIHLLPKDWLPINADQPWIQISIDGDVEKEWLLLYTYDNAPLESANGQVGAVIYDSQQGAAFATEFDELSTPFQAVGVFIAYRILPNYWQDADTGFVATNDLKTNITVEFVSRSEKAELPEQEADSDAEELYDEAIIYAGEPSKAMTVIWWRSKYDGYGIANVYAAGGLFNPEYDGGNAGNSPVVSITGMHPFHDRSQLCQEVLYTRTLAPERDGNDPYRPAIRYDQTPKGIKFCTRDAHPTHPFYPEGVVLKYLLTDRAEPGSLVHADAETNKLTTALDFKKVESVRALRAPLSLKFGAERFPEDVSVCAELLVDGGQPRWYTFQLKHSPPDLEQQVTDQLSIVNVNPIPAPETGKRPDCSEEVEGGTPEKLTSP